MQLRGSHGQDKLLIASGVTTYGTWDNGMVTFTVDARSVDFVVQEKKYDGSMW
jgi:hypothetical protein